jgi:polyphosphate kinase 2
MAKGKKANADSKTKSGKAGKPKRLNRKTYEAELERLQGELVKVQYWLEKSGTRIIVVFEGRDSAGKGGIISRITDKVSHRVFRTVALPAPSERERTQLYMQRYITNFPAAGEIVLFDRSWYNRAGVERVMGFCSDEEYQRFMAACPIFEQMVTGGGVQLIKYWLEIGQEEQTRRFQSRIDDPRKLWKLSPMDLESHKRWYDYSKARDAMLEHTHTAWAPWHVVPADDKRRARLNCISHLLSEIPYDSAELEMDNELPKRAPADGYMEADISRYRILERF